MTGQVQQGIDLRHGHALGTLSHLYDLVAGFDFSLLPDPEVEAGSAVRDEQRGHLRLVHADADPVARRFRFQQPSTASAESLHRSAPSGEGRARALGLAQGELVAIVPCTGRGQVTRGCVTSNTALPIR